LAVFVLVRLATPQTAADEEQTAGSADDNWDEHRVASFVVV
jgi:hypothetical protein